LTIAQDFSLAVARDLKSGATAAETKQNKKNG
jgi:hypothetical protein